MKNRYIFSLIITIVLLIIIDLVFLNKNLISFNNDLNNLQKYFNMFYSNNEGILTLNAEYKGAHGEIYPSTYKYGYVLNDNSITIGNDEGFKEINFNSPIIKFVNNIKNKSTNIEMKYMLINRIYLNSSKFNEIFKTNYKKVYIKCKLNGYVLVMDNDYIEVKNDSLKGLINDKNIKLAKNNNGFSLSINDNLKINMFIDDFIKYDIVLNNYVYSFSKNNNSIKFRASSQASIYNAIEILLESGNISINKEKEIPDLEFPLTRYFSEVDLKI